MLDQLKEFSKQRYVSPVWMAKIDAGLGTRTDEPVLR